MEKKWLAGAPAHIYMRGTKGWVIFYRLEDFLCYTSLIYIISRKCGVRIISMSLMINHIHLLIMASSQAEMSRFVSVLNMLFAKEYNEWYHRQGKKLFEASFGWAQKAVAKDVRSCMAYIGNNPVVGHLASTAKSYRWNLLAYHDCKYPFSEKIVKSRVSRKLRRSMDMVTRTFNSGGHLNYTILHNIFTGLDPVEARQLSDYILSLYNPLDYTDMKQLYGDVNSACATFELNAGGNYDLPDDWTDYSLYRKALKVTIRKLGDRHDYIENLEIGDIADLYAKLSSLEGMSRNAIKKFLHLNEYSTNAEFL